MTAAPSMDRENQIPRRKPAPGEKLELDVQYCDLVPPNEPGADVAVRFKGFEILPGGRRGEFVRVFVELGMAEHSMRRTGLVREPIPSLPEGEQTLPIKLERRRVVIDRQKGVRGATWYVIGPSGGALTSETASAEEQLLADYHWAYGHARNDVIPLIQADGLPIGTTDVLAITRELFLERRRGRQGRQ